MKVATEDTARIKIGVRQKLQKSAMSFKLAASVNLAKQPFCQFNKTNSLAPSVESIRRDNKALEFHINNHFH